MLIEEDDDNDEAAPPPTGWDVNQLRVNMFAFTDGAGNLVYERIGTDTNKVSDGESEEEKEETKEAEESEEEVEETKSPEKRSSKKKNDAVQDVSQVITSSSVMVLDPKTNTPQAVEREEPLPRIKCGSIVNKNTLFIYGGLVEIGDREVTLDDMWSLDLKKRNKWKCLWPGTMHKQVWRGAVHDDDDSYISTGTGDGKDEEDSDDDEDDELEESKMEEVDPEVAELTEEFDLNNPLRTPQQGEALADFYSRTKTYWNEQAAEVLDAAEPTNKELKREGFQLARKRFEELEPVLEKLKGLNLGDAVEEKKSKKKSKKTKK